MPELVWVVAVVWMLAGFACAKSISAIVFVGVCASLVMVLIAVLPTDKV